MGAVINRTTEQTTELFSYRGMARRVFQNAWPKALLGGLILLIFLRDWRALAVFSVLLAFTIAQDAYRYGRCWEKHEELKRAYPIDYPPLLEEKLRERGAAALIDLHWAELRVALMKRLGLERMP